MGTQRALSRRGLLTGLAALVGPWSLAGCAKRDRPAVLSALVSEQVRRMVRELLVETRSLDAAIVALAQAPDPTRLRAATLAFKGTVVAWKRAYAFRAGPLASSQAFSRAAFWPARPLSIRALLDRRQPIEEQHVEQLSVDAKGLFAIEYLLFDRELGAHAASSVQPAGRFIRQYARELSANVLGYAQRTARLLGDARLFAGEFAHGGRASIDLLVAQSIDSLDIIAGKLDRVSRAAARAEARSSAVEGYFSGTSLNIARALLDGTRQLYLGGPGGGLTDLVTLVSKPIDEHVRSSFTEADERLQALGSPLELAIDRDPALFRHAAAAVSAAKHTLRVEMASALEG